MSKWIAIGDAAKYLGISRDTLRRWEKAGRIKPQRSPTNRRYYTKEQLDEVISNKPKRKVPSSQRKGQGRKSFKLILFGFLGFIIAAVVSWLVLFFLL